LIANRVELLDKEGCTYQEPRLEATPFYVPGSDYGELNIPSSAKRFLTSTSSIRETGIPEIPYLHQAQALEKFLGEEREIIVAIGTGSGKTESFLMPILGTMAEESESRPQSWLRSGCRALLLYPMNALVNDQISRLRKILGQEDVASMLQASRNHMATFGMYTSRTPYPGEESAQKNRIRLRKFIENAFLNLPAEAEERLKVEGKWPAKDLRQFVSSSFRTGATDAEMISRQEMMTRCPDILVTNYSMLEYMLLRPIEAPIFDQTAEWLSEDTSNKFIVVLDEAHMYKGAGGAEVAFLLRRLHSRLGVPRERVKYILTSASLGSSEEAQLRMKTFAAHLSGHEDESEAFSLITGQQQSKDGERVASESESDALVKCDYSLLFDTGSNLSKAYNEFHLLRTNLGDTSNQEFSDVEGFQNEVYQWLVKFGPAAFIANRITSSPQKLRDIAKIAFPKSKDSEAALECLLAFMSFAKEKESKKVFAPARAHLFFRGIPGLYACINPACGRTQNGEIGVLGRLRSTPNLTCECGSRVYEILTHRDCGAAFIRGYLKDLQGDFLWHEPSHGLWGTGGLLEAHFLVELNRRSQDSSGRNEGSTNWLHKSTGQISVRKPDDSILDQFIELLRPEGLVQVSGVPILTFNNQCPVCTTNWRPGSTKIMDLATKGEAPFAQLVRTQVELQPKTMEPTERSPNGGRKSLLFSDGRQKAARLARDIPREIENDVFRQLLILGVNELLDIGVEPRLRRLYVSMVHVLAKHSLFLFDGDDKQILQQHVREHQQYNQNSLRDALEDPLDPPASYSALLLRHLGSPFYSVSALTLAHIAPVKRALRSIADRLPALGRKDIENLITRWLQTFANAYAIDSNLPQGIRIKAAGHLLSGGLGSMGGFNRQTQDFLRERFSNLDEVCEVFSDVVCQSSPSRDGLFLDPNKLSIELSSENQSWYQCSYCAAVSPVEWWGHCPVCLSSGTASVNPGKTDYLRARKAFFRDPVVDVLDGKVNPFNLSVEEHTAQLSYRDIEDPSTTTEDFERRFRDIIVSPSDTSIDVLSSTTTMEVGIDIGSLVAVGLRKVPPLRQNYQQRAGRTGRRGSAISTVLTYAQNSPHDNHYFDFPEQIISGEPTPPGIDIENPKIVERHIRAQLLQAYFHFENPIPSGSDVFSVLGKTLEFYGETSTFSLAAFKEWIESVDSAKTCFDTIEKWLPCSFDKSPLSVARDFCDELEEVRPQNGDELENSELKLIEFLFSRGFLPSYAFPRDLCALQIEGPPVVRNGFTKVNIIQRPQQGLNIALSEYAPGRFVVVDKKTYRVGSVAASGSTAVENRAARLFSEPRYYLFCPECEFTLGFRFEEPSTEECPLCGMSVLEAKRVIVPQVVFPDGGREVNEYDDEQVFTSATSAQLSVPEDSNFNWNEYGNNCEIAFARNQQLVMVNKGEEENGNYEGFSICNQCGKAAIDESHEGAHERDYHVSGRNTTSRRCLGRFENVYLGCNFNSDALLIHIPISNALRFSPVNRLERAPISDAIQSLAEALVLGIGRALDIDIREINAGFRFQPVRDENFADIFVYDTLSGGAGYATQAGEAIDSVILLARELLENCDCSSSCDKCLRHYGNRFHHSTLDRFIALDLLNYLLDGVLPEVQPIEDQRVMLSPLATMLELAGWDVSGSNTVPVIATNREGRTINLHLFPSLVRPEHYGFEPDNSTFAFTAYELSRDLPGAYGVLA